MDPAEYSRSNKLPKILVVDDQKVNIRLLERKLMQFNMRVLSASSGELALQVADEEVPDVILLDIMMPGMDGIDVCRHLKDNPRTKDIPVIFVTARGTKEGKIEGLGAGAADYLIKPIDLDETIARVQTQIRIVESHRENLRLTHQLEESKRQTAMMNLTEGIAHNLNNLLGVTVGYLSLLKRNASNPEKIESHCNSLDSAIKRMTRIVHQLTVIGQFDSINVEPCLLRKVLNNAISRFHKFNLKEIPVEISTDLETDFEFVTNAELLEACLERLIQNAFESYQIEEASAAPPENGIKIEIRLDLPNNSLYLDVLDLGPGIPDEIKDNIFDPFVSSFSAVGKGMGLTIVQHSVKSLQGTVEVFPRVPGPGTCARITIPMDLLPSKNQDDDES